jgi:Acetyltransferase (GNAT) domain
VSASSADSRCSTAGGCTWAEPVRLELVPVIAEHAEELNEVFGDERLYVFFASQPTTTEELRDQFARLAVGMLQAAFSDQGRAAEIAWAVGVAWQGQGIASEAARAVVGWLERRGVATITAHIHSDHHASAKVATRAGLLSRLTRLGPPAPR